MLKLRKIAVTGGLSSGKSTVCHLFKELGAHVVSADEIGHQLLSSETTLGKQIINVLGQDVIINGKFDRGKIAEKVFKNQVLLKKLEALLHPAVYEEMRRKYQQVQDKKEAKLFVAEIPLFFESVSMDSNDVRWFDAIVNVDAPQDICIERYISKGGSRDEFFRRMQNQLPPLEKSNRSHYVIDNSGDLNSLKKQVTHIYNSLIQ